MSKTTILPANDETQSQAIARYLSCVVAQAEAVREFTLSRYYERGCSDDFAVIVFDELAEYVCGRIVAAVEVLNGGGQHDTQ